MTSGHGCFNQEGRFCFMLKNSLELEQCKRQKMSRLLETDPENYFWLILLSIVCSEWWSKSKANRMLTLKHSILCITRVQNIKHVRLGWIHKGSSTSNFLFLQNKFII